MITIVVVVFTLVGVLSSVGMAGAQMLFDFGWTSSASYSTLIPVNRVEPDGGVTPFDPVRLGGTRSGTGVLALTPQADGFSFTFSGAGGTGGGGTLAGGEILQGRLIFPLPADVPVRGPGSPELSGGWLAFDGPRAQPTGVSMAYFEGASPHCMFECSSIEFRGLGTRRSGGSTVTASEPASMALVGIALLVAARLRRRVR